MPHQLALLLFTALLGAATAALGADTADMATLVIEAGGLDAGGKSLLRQLLQATSGIDVFQGTPTTVSVRADYSVLDALASGIDALALGIVHRYDDQGDQRAPGAAFSRNAANDVGSFPAGTDLHDYRPDKWYPYADIVNVIKRAAGQFSHRVTKVVVGKSHENRDIYMLKITNGDGNHNKKGIFIDGGIHAREWIAPGAMLHLIWALTTKMDSDQSVKKLLETADVFVVPVLNPDGYEYSWTAWNRYWRKNMSPCPAGGWQCCMGTDLNRQFAYHWGESGTSSDTCDNTYKGASAMSEPEAKALQAAITPIKDRVMLYATVHSFGQMILVPYGYAVNVHPPNYARMMDVAKRGEAAMNAKHGAAYTAMDSTDLYPAAGISSDWVRAVLGIPYAYTFEMRPSSTSVDGFAPSASEAPKAGEELLAAITAMWGRVLELEGGSATGSPPTTAATTPPACAGYLCESAGGGGCIPAAWKCDGYPDCAGGDDERDCCPGYRCAQGGRECISAGWRCDGYMDCVGGDDEADC